MLPLPGGRGRRAPALAVAALLATGLGLQLYFFERFPQPVLFGDPAGYLKVGDAFQDALVRVGAGESVASAFERVRGYFYLLGTGALFAMLDALFPGDLAAWRRVMALWNTLAMLAAFLLGRRLARHPAGGFVALTLAALYPPFSVQTGRLYPDPVTGALFTFAAWALLRAIDDGSRRAALAAGALLCAAGVVRTQIAPVLLAVATALAVVSWPWWRRDAGGRRVAAGFGLGLAPLALCWGLVTWSVGLRDDVIQLGNVTFKTPYPMGYWMFVDSGGWPGTYKLKTEPYYQDLARAAQADPELLRSKPRQYVFTLRWLLSRPKDAIRQPLVNAYRLYERPANDYKWDYPFDYARQVHLQRALAVLALAGVALTLAEAPARALALAFPLALLPLHAVVFSWPRYNLPAMPIVLAVAGAFVARAALAAVDRRVLRGPGLALGGALLATGAAALLADPAPGLARATGELAVLAAIGAPLALAAGLGGPHGKLVAGTAFALAALLRLGHVAQDRTWHEREITLGGETTGVRQQLELGADALAALRRADAVALMLDLRVPRGDLGGARLRVGGHELPQGALQPTMPRLPESTSTGGRDWRGYPQWWAALLPADSLPAAPGPLEIALDVDPGDEIALRADRFAEQERFYDGPSFGDWPHFVPLKLEVDGDYRLGVRRPLGSAGTRTGLVTGGVARPSPAVARVRLVALANAAAGTRWTSAPTPARGNVALGFFAWSGVRQDASLWIDGVHALDFVLSERDGLWRGGGFRLCQRGLGDRGDKAYAALVLEGPSSGTARTLEVRFSTAFARQRAYFVADRKGDFAALGPHFAACGVAQTTPRAAGVASVLEASRNSYPEDTGLWRVESVY